jgi:hypothetical protein
MDSEKTRAVQGRLRRKFDVVESSSTGTLAFEAGFRSAMDTLGSFLMAERAFRELLWHVTIYAPHFGTEYQSLCSNGHMPVFGSAPPPSVDEIKAYDPDTMLWVPVWRLRKPNVPIPVTAAQAFALRVLQRCYDKPEDAVRIGLHLTDSDGDKEAFLTFCRLFLHPIKDLLEDICEQRVQAFGLFLQYKRHVELDPALLLARAGKGGSVWLLGGRWQSPAGGADQSRTTQAQHVLISEQI